jgi:hypothetical protein
VKELGILSSPNPKPSINLPPTFADAIKEWCQIRETLWLLKPVKLKLMNKGGDWILVI